MPGGRAMPDVQPVRVLLVAPSLGITGGQAVQAKRLLDQFAKQPEVAVDFMAIDPPLPRWIEKLKYVRTIARFLIYIPMVIARVPRYDIIHAFSASYWSYLLWSFPPVLFGRLFGKKTIVNYRSGEADDHLTRWRSAVPTLKLADVIVAPSGYLVDLFPRFGLSAISIFNILDRSKFPYRARREIEPIFLSNRGLEPLYNVACTLRAFHLVQQRYPDARLTVAHDGACRPKLQALAQELGLRNVQFVGQIPNERMRELYRETDIYLTSPDLDCMPGSLLECYSSGLPIIATKAGGIPYIVRHGETGLLVELNDHQAMAQCAIRLLEDPALVERMTANGVRECEKYTAEAVGREWGALYRKLLGRN